MRSTYYDVLGVPEFATPREMQEAFDHMSILNLWHYESFGEHGKADEDGVNQCLARKKNLDQAYMVLGNPEKRKQYDKTIYNGFDFELMQFLQNLRLYTHYTSRCEQRRV